jgi:hypothetical protein
MTYKIEKYSVSLVAVGTLLLCGSAGAQTASSPSAQVLQSYNPSREVSLMGTVVKYDAASTAPMGAHVLLQTSAGQVDVHLGNARLLQSGNLQLNAGDNVRIVGETLALGDTTFFAARIVQKGTQAVILRSRLGFPLAAGANLTAEQKEALRGAR